MAIRSWPQRRPHFAISKVGFEATEIAEAIPTSVMFLVCGHTQLLLISASLFDNGDAELGSVLSTGRDASI